MQGAIWAKPTWGVWWDWDPRLTTVAILLTAFLGPRILRQHSHWPCILLVGGSFFVSFGVFLNVYNAGEHGGGHRVADPDGK